MFCKGTRGFSIWKEEIDMDQLDSVLTLLDFAINSERKRHIAGGILLSVSLLFGGLAFTVMTTKMQTELEEIKENSNERF
jgi:hypothetical protein